MASLLLNNTTVASTTTDRLHRHHHHRCCCKFGIEETQQVVVVMTRKLSYTRRINFSSPSAHSFLFVLLLLFQLLSHVVVLALSFSSPLSISLSGAEDPVAISTLVKSSSSPPSIITTTDAAFHHLSEYNEWRASVDNKKIQEAISTSSDTAAQKETTYVSNSSTTEKNGSLSPLFENVFASTSVSRRNSLEEIMSSLDIDNSEQTTLDLLIGDDTNIFAEELHPSQPIASTSTSAQLNVANEPVSSASLPGTSTMREDITAFISTQKQPESQFRHILPNMVPSSSSQIQKKEKKKKGRNKDPENPLLMLMRAAQQLAPKLVLPILKNKSSQHKSILALTASSKPPKLTPKVSEASKDEGNSHASTHNDKHMEMEMPILSPSSPLVSRMVEPAQVLTQHPNDPSPPEKPVNSAAAVVDLTTRKISTTSLSSLDTSFSASSSEDLTRESHNAPSTQEPTSSNRIKLYSVMPDPLLSYSSGEDNDPTEKRQTSLIPPASFIIDSLAPLYQEFSANNFKGLMLRKKSLPSFHTIKKRRLPRSIFVEAQANNRLKRYKIEGDKDEEEDRENKAPIDGSRLAIIRKRRNALYFNMLQNRLEGQKPLQLQQQTQQQRYPFPYPGINLPQYEQRTPTPTQTLPLERQPYMQSGQMNQFYNFQPQQGLSLTPTLGAPVRSHGGSSQIMQSLSPLRQQLSRGPINLNNPQLRMQSNNLNNYAMRATQSLTPPPNVLIVPSTTSSDNFLFKTPLPVVSRPSSRLESRLTSSSPSPLQQQASMQRNLMVSPNPQFSQQRLIQQPMYPFQSPQSPIAPNSGQQYPYMRGPMSPRIPHQQNPAYNQHQQQRYQNPQYFGSAQSGLPRYSPSGQYTDIPARPGPSGTPFTTTVQMPLTNNYFQSQVQQSQLPPSSTMQTAPYRSPVLAMTPSYGGPPSPGPFYSNQGEGLGTGMIHQASVRMPSPYSASEQPQLQQPIYPMQNRLYNDDPFPKFGNTGNGNAGRFETPSYSTTSQGYPRDTSASPSNQENFGKYRGAQGYTSPSQQQQWKQPNWPVGPRTPGPGPYSRMGIGQQQPQYYGQSANGPIQGQVATFPNQQGPGNLGNVDRKTPGQSQIYQQSSEQPTQPQRYLTPAPTIEGTGGGWIPYQRNNPEQRVPAVQQGPNAEFNFYPKYFTPPQQQRRYSSPQLRGQQNLAPSNSQQFTQLERKQDTPNYGGSQVAQPSQQSGQQNFGNQATLLGVGGSQFAPLQQQNVQGAGRISGYQYQQQPLPGRSYFIPSQRPEGVPIQQQNIHRADNPTPSLGGTQSIQSHKAPKPSPSTQSQNASRIGTGNQQDTSSVGNSQYTQTHSAPTQNIDAGRNDAPGKQGNPAGIQSDAQAGSPSGPSHSSAYEQFIRSTTTPAPEVISGGERVLFRSKPSGPEPSSGGLGGSFDRQGGTTQGAGGAGAGRSRGEFTLPIIDNPQEKFQLQKQSNNGPTNQRPVHPSPQYQQSPGGQAQQGFNSEVDRPRQQQQQPTTPTQQFISSTQQQQQSGGEYRGGNIPLGGGSNSVGSASGQSQRLPDTSGRGLNSDVGVGNSTSRGRTGDSNNNGRETPQAQRGGISGTQSGSEEGTPKAHESHPEQVQKAQIGKHLPHHGGDLPFYSQSELDAHHQRVSHNSQTPKDTEFENDSAILSWYLQRAKQELRHRQKSGRHKEPQEEARQRDETTRFGSPSHQPRVRSAPFQPGNAGKTQLRLSHPHSAGTSGDRPATPFYNAPATSQQTQNSSFGRLSQVSYPSKMVQTSSNTQEIHSSAPTSGYQSYANQNGIPSLSQPRPASASPASSSSVPSQGSAAIYSYGSYPRNGGTGPVQQLNNPTRPKRSFSNNPWYHPS